MKEETLKYTYNLGKRDAVAEICMMARDKEPAKVLREIATQLLEVDKDHPHAKWVLDKL